MIAPIIVGISGATGAIYGVETLRVLKELGQPIPETSPTLLAEVSVDQ